MLSAVITSQHSYRAVPLAGQLVHQWLVRPGPLVLGSTLLNLLAPTADRDRTVSRRSEPSSRTALNGEQPYPWDLLQPQDCDEPTSRCQTSPSMWALGGDQPVIPGVPFILWAMALPHRTTGSLRPTFVSAWRVCLAVKLAYAFILYERFPTVLSQPL